MSNIRRYDWEIEKVKSPEPSYAAVLTAKNRIYDNNVRKFFQENKIETAEAEKLLKQEIKYTELGIKRATAMFYEKIKNGEIDFERKITSTNRLLRLKKRSLKEVSFPATKEWKEEVLDAVERALGRDDFMNWLHC